MDTDDTTETEDTTTNIVGLAVLGVFAFAVTYTTIDITDVLFFRRKRIEKAFEEELVARTEKIHAVYGPALTLTEAFGKDQVLETIYETPNMN